MNEAAEGERVGQGEAEGEGGTLGGGEGEEEEYGKACSSFPALTGSTASLASAAGPEAADGHGRPAPEGLATVKEAGASSKELPAAQPQQKGGGLVEGGAPGFAAAAACGSRREQPAWRIPAAGRLLEGAECQQQREPPQSPAEPSSPPNSQPLLSSTLGPSGASAGAGATLPDWLLRSEHTEVGARKAAAAQQAATLPVLPWQRDCSAGARREQAQQGELDRAPRPAHAGAPAAASALVLESTELAPAAAAAAVEAAEAAVAAEQAAPGTARPADPCAPASTAQLYPPAQTRRARVQRLKAWRRNSLRLPAGCFQMDRLPRSLACRLQAGVLGWSACMHGLPGDIYTSLHDRMYAASAVLPPCRPLPTCLAQLRPNHLPCCSAVPTWQDSQPDLLQEAAARPVPARSIGLKLMADLPSSIWRRSKHNAAGRTEGHH